MKTHRFVIAAALLALLFAAPAQAVDVYLHSSAVNATAPLTAKLTVLVAPPETNVAKYEWDFDGDGTVDQETNVPDTTHLYGNAGTYNATVTVTDANGSTYTASTKIQTVSLQ